MGHNIGKQVGITAWKSLEARSAFGAPMTPWANLSPHSQQGYICVELSFANKSPPVSESAKSLPFLSQQWTLSALCPFPHFSVYCKYPPGTWNAGKKKNTNCLTRGVTHGVKNGWSWNESIRETNRGTCHAVNNRERTVLSAFIDAAAASECVSKECLCCH